MLSSAVSLRIPIHTRS